jgi:hypothetical protein
MPIAHPKHGTATLIDNLPLTEAALEKSLDSGMSPAEWLRLLNARDFFWATEERLSRHLMARAHAKKIDLCPINSGSTFRKPALRGAATFTPMGRYDFDFWRRLRGQPDEIVEVTILAGVPDIARHVVKRSLRRAE